MVYSATSAYVIEDFPVTAQSFCEDCTIKCIHWIQNTLKITTPIDPTHRPANETARGKANIPGPMLPLTV